MKIHVESPRGAQTIQNNLAAGMPLTAALRAAGLPLNTRCGERGVCDGCVIELLEGSLRHRDSEVLVTASGKPITMHGCTHELVEGDVSVRIGDRSLLAYEPSVLTEFSLNVPRAQDPLWRGESAGREPLGVAVDIGTTTVALLLVNLLDGQVLASASGFNRQMDLGDDVVTRINLCSTDATMLAQLHRAVVKHTLEPLLHRALRHARRTGDDVTALCVTGNTTMLHLLAQVDPSPLGVAPFTPVFLDARTLRCGALNLAVHEAAGAGAGRALEPDPVVQLLPGAAAYVGADIVAGLLASGMAYRDEPCLLVDVGTNGEIVLKHGDYLLGCATAAGPAFEGARLASGIRAGQGAVCSIALGVEPFAVRVQTIGAGEHARPIGLCGSAYIDFLAEARRVGLLTASGRFDADALPDAQPHLLRDDDHGLSLRVAEARSRAPLVVSEADVASLLQAKAAIAAGISCLLEEAHLQPGDIATLYLAGGFGFHMNHRNAIACGMLPGFDPRQVQVIGNSALAGAYLALTDRSALGEMSRLARRINVLELNLLPQFEGRFVDSLAL